LGYNSLINIAFCLFRQKIDECSEEISSSIRYGLRLVWERPEDSNNRVLWEKMLKQCRCTPMLRIVVWVRERLLCRNIIFWCIRGRERERCREQKIYVWIFHMNHDNNTESFENDNNKHFLAVKLDVEFQVLLFSGNCCNYWWNCHKWEFFYFSMWFMKKS
jgi:hypothetical protein